MRLGYNARGEWTSEHTPLLFPRCLALPATGDASAQRQTTSAASLEAHSIEHSHNTLRVISPLLSLDSTARLHYGYREHVTFVTLWRRGAWRDFQASALTSVTSRGGAPRHWTFREHRAHPVETGSGDSDSTPHLPCLLL